MSSFNVCLIESAERVNKFISRVAYTLVYHSRGFQLIQHEPFQSTAEAVRNGTDIKSSTQIVEMTGHRMRVRDTDKGRSLQQQIEDLYNLLYAYRHGLIPEQQG